MTQTAIQNANVSAVFENYPPRIREKLLLLRQLIFEVASEIKEIGILEETLKWGQPSYLTSTSKSGSTIRIDQVRGQPSKYAIYFNCQTSLIESCKQRYPNAFGYEGNRSIYFDVDDELPTKAVKECIALALTYHLNKNTGGNKKTGQNQRCD